MIGFVIRLAGFGILLGAVTRVALIWWSQFGLDDLAALQRFHDTSIGVLLVAPVVLALIGFGRLSSVAVFAGCFLAGAALTAPLVCARVAGL
jgi:hypothetical protein